MSAPSITVPDHVYSLAGAENTNLHDLAGAPLVAVSSAMFEKLTGYNRVRFDACVAATESYTRAGVRQLVMVDDRSDYRVPQELARRGAIVVPTPRPGLATPYLDAVQLVRLHAGPTANVLKAEGDKLITAENLTAIEAALHSYDVVVGDRSVSSLESMSPIQQRTEAIIDATLAGLLGIPHGASSGVQAYTPHGLRVFLAYEDVLDKLGNNWKYLLYVPAIAINNGLHVGNVMLDLSYDAQMVSAENTPTLTLKRLEQLLLMLEGGYEVATFISGSSFDYGLSAEQRHNLAEAQLRELRMLVQS
jgi:hypothetical protein